MQTTIATFSISFSVFLTGAAFAGNGGRTVPRGPNGDLNRLVDKAVSDIGGRPSLGRMKLSFRVTGGADWMQAKKTVFTNQQAANAAHQKLASENVQYLPNIEKLKAPTRTFYQVTIGDAGGVANFNTKAEADAAVAKAKTIAYSMRLYTHQYEPYTTKVEGGLDAWDAMDRSRNGGIHSPTGDASNILLYGNH